LERRIDNSKLRVMFHTVAPWIRSGYGNLCNNIGTRLSQKYLVVASCYYGCESGGVVNFKGILVIPAKKGPFGRDSCIFFYKSFKIDIAILMTDGWAFPWFPKNITRPYFYGPMDSYDYGEEIVNMFRGYEGLISPSKFQVREWQKYGLQFHYIPHGVDLGIFKPMSKEKAREITNIPKDKFILGTVAANADKETRKGWDRMMKGVRYFLEQNPDARRDFRWVIHTNPVDPRGVHIHNFLVKHGIRDLVSIPEPMMTETGLSGSQMMFLYNSFDVLINTSWREGFGLPILEAMACGVPVIATDCTSMTELVKGHGWLVKPALTGLNMISTPINAETTIPDVYDIAKKIEEAYNNPNLIAKYGIKSRKFSLAFNWDDIVNTMWIPYLDNIKIMRPWEMIGINPKKDELWEKKKKELI